MGRGGCSGIWIFSEDMALSLEILGRGRELADRLGKEVAAILVGHHIESRVDELIDHGADRVFMAEDPGLQDIQVEPLTEIIADLVLEHDPEALLIGATKRGRELAPRVAARLGVGCVSDCFRLDVDEAGRLLMDRLMYGGSAIATEICNVKPQMATISPRTFERAERKSRHGMLVRLDIEVRDARTKILEKREKKQEGGRIEDSSVVVCGGRGVGRREDLKILEELAQVLGGVVACSRPLSVDLKWFTDWVGLSGHKIKPALYVGCCISGAIQHIAGIRGSRTIVAINTDPEAPIFQSADYGVVGDFREVIPALTEALKKLLKR